MARKLTGEDRGYFAALIDGEGCIRIGRFKNKNGDLRYRAYCHVAMTAKGPIRWLAQTIGGKIYIDRRPNYNKPVYCWQINAKTAAKNLKKILHLLRVKRKQATILRQFAATLAGPGGSGEPRPVSKSMLQFRRKLWWRNRNLNKKAKRTV